MQDSSRNVVIIVWFYIFGDDVVIANSDNRCQPICVNKSLSLTDIWCLPVVCVEDKRVLLWHRRIFTLHILPRIQGNVILFKLCTCAVL